jgi:anthranilate synthase component 1
MKALPARSGFGEIYAAGKPQVVWTTLVSDLETPVSAMIKLADGQSNCFRR